MTTTATVRRRYDDDLPAGHHPSRLSRTLIWTGLVLFLIYSIAPVWFLIVSATKSQRDLYTTNGLWFADFHLFDNARDLFTYHDGIFLRWLANTLLYGVAGTVGMTVICVACGYGLAMYQFRGRGILMGCIIASFLIPGALLTIPSFLLYTRLHIVDTPWAIIVPHFFSAFSVYLAKVYAEGAIPPELLEAARVDGAGEYRAFFTIGARLMTTGSATIFLLGFVGSWNSFFGPLVFLRGEQKWTVMLGLYSWLNIKMDRSVDLTGLVIVGSIVSLVPIVVLMLAMQRYWRSGITLGSLK
jgi:multiple sugar transport system permease protein